MAQTGQTVPLNRPFADALSYAVPVVTLMFCFTVFSMYTVIVKLALNDGTSPLVLAFLREVLALAVSAPPAEPQQLRS